jgi:hypothetical protein
MDRNPYPLLGFVVFYLLVIVGLIAAKVAGHLAWSWWLVLLPIYGPVALVAIIVIFAIAGITEASRNGENPFQ